jgi:serine/threonine-protein kinase RsbW
VRNESGDIVEAPSGRPPTLRRVVPAVPASIAELRAQAREFAQGAGAEESVGADVALAISEAATNVVVHAYQADEGGPLDMVGKAEGEWLEFVVSDRGSGFRPSPSGGLGFGMKVMAEVCDSMTVTQGDAGTSIKLRFSRVRADRDPTDR